MNKLSLVIILAVFVSVMLISGAVAYGACTDSAGREQGCSCFQHYQCGSGCCAPEFGTCTGQDVCDQYYTCTDTAEQECKVGSSCPDGYSSGDGTCQTSGTICCKATCTQTSGQTCESGTSCPGGKTHDGTTGSCTSGKVCCKAGSGTGTSQLVCGALSSPYTSVYDKLWCCDPPAGVTIESRSSSTYHTTGSCATNQVVCGAANDANSNDKLVGFYCCDIEGAEINTGGCDTFYANQYNQDNKCGTNKVVHSFGTFGQTYLTSMICCSFTTSLTLGSHSGPYDSDQPNGNVWCGSTAPPQPKCASDNRQVGVNCDACSGSSPPSYCGTCCSYSGDGGGYCGDGVCDPGESCSLDDSACGSNSACTNGCVALPPLPNVVAKTPLLNPTGMASYTKKLCNAIDDTGNNCALCQCGTITNTCEISGSDAFKCWEGSCKSPQTVYASDSSKDSSCNSAYSKTNMKCCKKPQPQNACENRGNPDDYKCWENSCQSPQTKYEGSTANDQACNSFYSKTNMKCCQKPTITTYTCENDVNKGKCMASCDTRYLTDITSTSITCSGGQKCCKCKGSLDNPYGGSLVNKGIICNAAILKSNNEKPQPVCGGTPNSDGKLSLTMDNCARAGPWLDVGYPPDVIVCTNTQAPTGCGTELFHETGDGNVEPNPDAPHTTITDDYGATYRVYTCKNICVPNCLWIDERTYQTRCLAGSYMNGTMIGSSFVSGHFLVLTVAQNIEEAQCTYWPTYTSGHSNHLTPPWDFRIRKANEQVGLTGKWLAWSDSILCTRGCSAPACKADTAPTINSVSGMPVNVKKDDIINVNAAGSDKDIIYTESGSFAEPVRLACSSQSVTGKLPGGKESTCSFDADTNVYTCNNVPAGTTGFNPDLCTGNFFASNPRCTITVTWTTNEKKTIFCRLQDMGGNYSIVEKNLTVTVDNNGPHVEIKSPDENTNSNPILRDFSVVVNDTDEGGTGLATCNYSITFNGVLTKNATRTCNSAFTVTVGKNKDCGRGECVVLVRGFDKAGNSAEDPHKYHVNYIFSNITTPKAGSWQPKSFNATVEDKDYSGGTIDTCQYKIAVSSEVKKDWTERNCNARLEIGVGPTEYCNEQGNDACWIYLKANNTDGEEGTPNIIRYKIDWSTPHSTILSPLDSGTWRRNSFMVDVKDEEYRNVGFEKCEYMVESKGVVTKAWTTRTCNSQFEVTVGAAGYCRHEGAGTCTVHVKAQSKTGNMGEESNMSYSILLSNIFDPDGFSNVRNITGDCYSSFSGEPKHNLFSPIFRVCNDGTSVEACKNAYTPLSDNCGIDKPCLCGSFNTFNCNIACGDVKGKYYLMETGVSGIDEVIIISQSKDFACPFLNLTGLRNLLNVFKNFNTTFSTQILMYDNLITRTNDQALIEQYRRDQRKYIEAKMVVIEHIIYLEDTLKTMCESKSKEAIEKTRLVLKQLEQILSSGRAPTDMNIIADIPDGIRFNTSADLPIIIRKTGDLALYANLTCKITKPNGAVINSSTACLDFTAPITIPEGANYTHHLLFDTIPAGDWTIECTLYGSINSECKRGVRYDTLYKRFISYPPYDPYITNVTVPAEAVNGSTIDIIVNATNPEVFSFYAKARCTFRNPDGTDYGMDSSCLEMYGNENKLFTVSKNVDKHGLWTVKNCSINISTNSQCTSSVLRNSTDVNKDFNAVLPSYVYISSVNVPATDVINGTKALVRVTVNNPIEYRFIFVSYMIEKPDGIITGQTDCTGISTGDSKTFNIELRTDKTGVWNVAKVFVNASLEGTCAGSTMSHSVSGKTFNVVKSNNLTIISVEPLNDIKINTQKILDIAIDNPFGVDKYGYVRCNIKTPSGPIFTNISSCRLMTRLTTTVINIGAQGNAIGLWNITSCAVLSSDSQSCTNPSQNHIVYDIGTYNVVDTADPYITSAQLSANSVVIGGTVNVYVNVTNLDTETKHVKSQCMFRGPDGINRYDTTDCMHIVANSNATFILSLNPEIAGTWTVPQCVLNVSANEQCTASAVRSQKTSIGTFTVTMPNTLYIGSINVPKDVINDTDVTISANMFNPLPDMYARLRCIIKKPDMTTSELVSSCLGISTGSSRAFTLSLHPTQLGTWYIERCFAEGSSQSSCANVVQYYNTTGPSFNVAQTTNLTILSVTPAASTLKINSTQILTISVRNPSAIDRYARVTCRVSKPNTQTIDNTTSCMLINDNSVNAFNLGFYANLQGTWDVQYCTVYSSMNNDCSAASLHHTKINAASYNVYTTFNPYITSARLSSNNVVIGGTLNVILNVTNPETTENVYGFSECRFQTPTGNKYTKTACSGLANGNSTITVAMQTDELGLWRVASCKLNASSQSNCLQTTTTSTLTNIGTFNVTMPNSLFINSITIPSDVLNDTDASININTFNPLGDMYGRVRCTVQKPDLSTNEFETGCIGIQSNSARAFQIAIHPQATGLWRITSCAIYGTTNSNCDNAAQHYNVSGPSFNVVQGANLTILSITPALTTIKINNTQTVTVAVRNPGIVDRYAKVTCSFRKPNNAIITNTTACTRIPASSTQDFSINAYADSIGTWDVISCYVSSSLNNDCSSSTIHDTKTISSSYNVVSELNLTIKGIRISQDTIFLNNYIGIIIDTRNPDNVDKYGVVSCNFIAPSNATYKNSTACEYMEREHDKTFEVRFYTNTSGTWYIRNCTLNASANIECRPAKIHATQETVGQVYVRSPDLMITGVVPPQTSLIVGDTAEIIVYVKNMAASNRTAYVNCSIMNPANITYFLVTPTRVIAPSATETFIPSVRVGVPGSWTVLTCAVYKIMSPATLEHQISINDMFSVLYPATKECTTSSDCFGTNDKCYCSNNACQSCGSGKICQNNACLATPAPECITDTGCPAGHICQNEKCVRKGDCTYDAHCSNGYKCENYNCVRIGQCIADSDCDSGYTCSSYSCVRAEKNWFDQNILNFIIILFIIILIPVLLFSYARRSI